MTARSLRFANILSRVGWPAPDVQLIGFTSWSPGQGVSTIASHVATATAVVARVRTLLVDLNYEKPILHKLFDFAQCPGIAGLSVGSEDVATAVRETTFENLSVLSAGNIKLLQGTQEESIAPVLKSLLNDFELVLCDLPHCGAEGNWLTPLAMMDRVVVVVDPSRSDGRQIKAGVSNLNRNGIRNPAIVLNRVNAFNGLDRDNHE